jgi:ABC-2 family transporter
MPGDVMKVWSNPEFVRHRRAELRTVRAITVGALVLVVCALVGLACWSSERELVESLRRASEFYGTEAWRQRLAQAQQDLAGKTWMLFYKWLIGMQGAALTFWTLFSCAQSISGERDRKTWEFQRVTRLTPGEILIGKLLGEPVLVYFAALCAAPITLIAGLAGGLPFGTVLSVYVDLAMTSLFLGLGGMWLSTLLESRTRGVGLIGALGLYFVTVMMFQMRTVGLPGLAAFSPLMVFFGLIPSEESSLLSALPVLFGHTVPWLLMCVLLCGSFSAWLAVMLLRNLKRDYPEIRPLSRWQAVACAAFLNSLIYALLRPSPVFGSPWSADARSGWFHDARTLATFAVVMNGLILFLMGVATLTPQERLKIWRRTRATGVGSVFAYDGLSWPWLGISATVAYALMVAGLLVWGHALPLERSTLQTAAVQLLVVLVFVTRDVLFLQWCMLTRLRQPVIKGFLYLCLYYAAAAVLATIGAVSSEAAGHWMAALLTPAQVFDTHRYGLAFPAATYVGLALQVGVIGVVLTAISGRLQRPMQAGAAA